MTTGNLLPPHTCRPPGAPVILWNSRGPYLLVAAPLSPGSVWRCHCQRLWIADGQPGQTETSYWSPAGWITRWQWRNLPPHTDGTPS